MWRRVSIPTVSKHPLESEPQPIRARPSRRFILALGDGFYMEFPGTGVNFRRALAAALLAGLVVAVVFVAFNWVRILLSPGLPDDPELVLGRTVFVALLSLAVYAPFLLAVVWVVSDTHWKSVTTGAVLVFAFALFLPGGRRVEVPFDPSSTELLVSMARVVSFLAVATAVWIAYNGGYERLTEPFDGVSHPLFANVADTPLGADLDLQRGFLAVVLAGLVGAGGLVLVDSLHDLLLAATAGGTTRILFAQPGIPLEQLPIEFVAEASFLLAVLFVVGAGTTLRGLAKGIAVVFAVQTPLGLVPALLAPTWTVDLWAPQGPVLAPASDALVLLGIAVAVWLAFRGGIEALRDRMPLRTMVRPHNHK